MTPRDYEWAEAISLGAAGASTILTLVGIADGFWISGSWVMAMLCASLMVVFGVFGLFCRWAANL